MGGRHRPRCSRTGQEGRENLKKNNSVRQGAEVPDPYKLEPSPVEFCAQAPGLLAPGPPRGEPGTPPERNPLRLAHFGDRRCGLDQSSKIGVLSFPR